MLGAQSLGGRAANGRWTGMRAKNGRQFSNNRVACWTRRARRSIDRARIQTWGRTRNRRLRRRRRSLQMTSATATAKTITRRVAQKPLNFRSHSINTPSKAGDRTNTNLFSGRPRKWHAGRNELILFNIVLFYSAKESQRQGNLIS